ncbi:hypothetical protein [Halovivax asiaticus]|uniref:hypothetical protein n=1 Tax=Halovivax asiaticus TaxID=332953 RepID=UPI0012674B4B|nr:hypothetical protein [Halovivax asiaticus]
MERRELLVSGGVAATALTASGLIWRQTQRNVAVEVINLTDERVQASLTVSTPTEELVYNETFDIGAGGSIPRYNVADVDEYRATIRVDDREHVHEIDPFVCHAPLIVFELEPGRSITSYSRC